MTHCIILTAYKDAPAINRFLARVPDDWGIYVHLDKKSKLTASDIDPRAKVFRWKKIYWGAWEHLYVIHKMLMLSHNEVGYDYYHICSGQDYFVTPPERFDDMLDPRGANYVNAEKFPRKHWRGGDGYDVYRYKTLASVYDCRKWFMKCLNKIYYFLQKVLHLGQAIPDFPLYGGTVYSTFHRDFVEWMQQSPLTTLLLNNLRNTICGEELFYQTLLFNSPFAESRGDYSLCYLDWNANPGPKFLVEEDFSPIVAVEPLPLFCRKIDSERSRTLCDRLDHFKP
ncbi:MAG: hypothetical protein MJZ63_02315 [Muribaculaceae bacterium]|nr:hypothetical protein [Muribaculaceae bacterium]